MSTTYTEIQTLHRETCCSCHIMFAMPEELYQARRRDHGWLYCPSGHPQRYTGPRPEDDLRTKLAEAERVSTMHASRAMAAREQCAAAQKEAEHFRKSRDGLKGVLAKERKRVSKGICPCCTHAFYNLKKHMQEKHPDHSGEGNLLTL